MTVIPKRCTSTWMKTYEAGGSNRRHMRLPRSLSGGHKREWGGGGEDEHGGETKRRGDDGG